MVRQIGLWFTVLMLLWTSQGITAQTDECSPDVLRTQVDTLLARYQTQQTDNVLRAISELEEELFDIIENCGARVPEGPIISGKWLLDWQQNSFVCPDGTEFPLVDTPVIVGFQDDILRVSDPLNPLDTSQDYRLVIGIVYDNLLVATTEADVVYSLNYRLFLESDDYLSGTVNLFYDEGACTALSNFDLTFQKDDVFCLVITPTGANIRAEPSIESERLGELEPFVPGEVIAYADGADELVWWQLANRAWVRSDVVIETGFCDRVSVRTP